MRPPPALFILVFQHLHEILCYLVTLAKYAHTFILGRPRVLLKKVEEVEEGDSRHEVYKLLDNVSIYLFELEELSTLEIPILEGLVQKHCDRQVHLENENCNDNGNRQVVVPWDSLSAPLHFRTDPIDLDDRP